MRKLITTLLLATIFIQEAYSDTMLQFHNNGEQQEIDCLSEAMYHEGAVDGKLGMLLIAEVIKNRVDDVTYEFKSLRSYCEVVSQPSSSGVYHECAFSYKCDGKTEDIFDNEINTRAFEMAYALAYTVLSTNNEHYLDLTDGALYYTQHKVWRSWMANTEEVLSYGGHTFRKRIGQEERKYDQPEVVVEKTCNSVEKTDTLIANEEWRFGL